MNPDERGKTWTVGNPSTVNILLPYLSYEKRTSLDFHFKKFVVGKKQSLKSDGIVLPQSSRIVSVAGSVIYYNSPCYTVMLYERLLNRGVLVVYILT